MVYVLQKRSDFTFDNMPVDNIAYARKGGCYITYVKGFLLCCFLMGLSSYMGALVFHSTQQPLVEKSLRPSLRQLIDNVTDVCVAAFVTSPKIIPKNYRLIIHPIFNESESPFTFYGTLRLTFTPDVLTLRTLQLDASASLEIFPHNLFVYRSRVLSASNFDVHTSQNEPNMMPTYKQLEESQTERSIEVDFDSGETPSTLIDNKENDFADDVVNKQQSESTEVEILKKLTDSRSAAYRWDQGSEDETEIVVTGIHHDKRLGKLNISVGLDLKFGHFYIVKLSFSGNINKNNGLLLTTYKERSGDRYFLASIGNTKHSSLAFPCVNDARRLATFDLSIYRMRSMQSVATAPRLSSEYIDTKWVIDIFKTSRMQSINEFGFALMEMDSKHMIAGNGTKITKYVRREMNETGVFEELKDIIIAFEAETGLPSGVRQLSIVGVPNSPVDFVQRRGNLLLISESFFVGNDSENYVSKLTMISESVRRLLFTEILSNMRNEFWLTQTLPLENVLSEGERLEKQFEAMKNEIQLDSVPLHQINDDNNENCVGMSQSKGLHLLEMIKYLLGEDKYAEAFVVFCDERKIPRSTNWMDILGDFVAENKTYSASVLEMMSSWTNQRGYPILTVSTVASNIQVTQASFGKSPTMDNVWIMPFTLITSSPNISTDVLWLNEQSKIIIVDEPDELDTDDFWMHIKNSRMGYYRVNYSERNWLALLNAIQRKMHRFSHETRAVLADDAFNLARQGYLSYSIVLKLIGCWNRHETEYLPWKVVLDNLDFVYDNSYDLAAFRDLKHFLADVIENTFKRIVLSPPLDEEFSTKLKTLITKWACLKLALPICIHNAKQIFDSLSTDGKFNRNQKRLEEVKNTCCSAIRYGFEDEWNLVFAALSTADMDYNAVIVESLGCSREPALISVYLGFLRKPSMSAFFPNIMKALAANDVARTLALEYVFGDIEYCLDSIGIDGMTSLLSKTSTEAEYKMLQDVYDRFPEKFERGSNRLYLRDILVSIESTLRWKTSWAKSINTVDWKDLHSYYNSE